MTDEQISLVTTEVDPQDVKQEAAVREFLTGNKQNKGIIYKELSSGDRVLYFGSYHRDLDQARLPWENSKNCSPRVIEEILDWAFGQSQSIQVVVFSFLDAEDKEAILPDILQKLGLDSTSKANSNKTSMADIMRKNLPATKDELIALIQSISVETKRPAATVRQFIRQETRKGKIYLAEDERYHLA